MLFLYRQQLKIYLMALLNVKKNCYSGFGTYYLCPLDHQELKRDSCSILYTYRATSESTFLFSQTNDDVAIKPTDMRAHTHH